MAAAQFGIFNSDILTHHYYLEFSLNADVDISEVK